MSMILIILLVIIIIIVAAVILLYNGLVSSRNRVKNSWAQIEVQLNRRADLIPNLVETVKGYASHEEGVFAKVTEARAGLMNANTVSDMADANNQLTQSLKSLFAVAEAYPELKASENFQNLQNQLSDTEDKIAYSRQFYNDTVLMYNNKCETFPGNIFAGMFGFKTADFFNAPEGAAQAPRVEF
jgi:LemA protein